MKALKERILRDGKCFEGGILKVDNFINHQMDPILMKSMAVEFVSLWFLPRRRNQAPWRICLPLRFIHSPKTETMMSA